MKNQLFFPVSLILLLATCTDSPPRTSSSADTPQVVVTSADSFYVTGPNFGHFSFGFAIGESDTVAPGTDGYQGGYLLLMTQEDTVQFDYVSTPYQQHHLVSVVSPTDTTVCILRFNAHTSEYTADYMKEHEGKADFAIPEVFELANIVWTLSSSGQQASNLRREGNYYKEVMAHFAPYQSHPVFNELRFPDSVYYEKYYSFRDNSVCFQFQGDSLQYSGPYYHVTGNFNQFGGLFKELCPLVEDFARKSNFRKFYQDHLPYYRQLTERQAQLMPVADMWSWLEREFPTTTFNSYRVIFSPLIGGSHSTQNFAFMGNRDDWFREALMFVSGPEDTDGNASLSEEQEKGLQSGVVFTEIDHNYVNPVSSKYRNEIEKVFSDRSVWTQAGGDTDLYTTPETVFNEYMTHAVFCLYVLDSYDEQTARFIIDAREALMKDHRHYVKFPQFNRKLAELYASKSEEETVANLYPPVLAWAATVR